MSPSKPVVIGLYGIPGCGKSFLLAKLKAELGEERFNFHEGSQVIANLVPGGLETFNRISDQEKTDWREMAIKSIQESCTESGKAAIVAGHFMFWTEGEPAGKVICTPADLVAYTHIIYLDTPSSTVLIQREKDTNRARPFQSQVHIQQWQDAEKTHLQAICSENNILFISLRHPDAIPSLVLNFAQDTPERNMAVAKANVDEILHSAILNGGGQMPETILVIDADKTLAEGDTGLHFWKLRAGFPGPDDFGNQVYTCSLKKLFGSPMGYSYAAFRQAALLYEGVAVNDSKEKFNSYCDQISATTRLYSEFVTLLKTVAEQKHVMAIVVTCGLRQIWRKVFSNHYLDTPVIGSGKISDGFIVTPEVKAGLVDHLRQVHRMRVWAFGDSVLDLPMMLKANHAVVVVGGGDRSKSMEVALERAIDQEGLRAVQVLLPSRSNIAPRLNTTKLPVVRFTDPDFLDRLLDHCTTTINPNVFHATARPAAKLLMTPTRNAKVTGPALREAHLQIGRYLAMEFVTQLVRVEEYPIAHVQGQQTDGYRLRAEERTCIIALMRGGEPMAFGVNDVFPLAMFVHAKDAGDVKQPHVQGRHTIILVDSVVNSGKSVVEFVRHIRDSLQAAHVQIVVVAGVVQVGSIKAGGLLNRAMEEDVKLKLVALRLSQNKFTGRGGTDTGNRLFNTTHVD